MNKTLLTIAALVLAAAALILAPAAQASVISFDFGSSGPKLGSGSVNSRGYWSHNASYITGASSAGDPVTGQQAGFSDFNFWDAVGYGEYPLGYGQTYDFRSGFSLPYYNNEFNVWQAGADPYTPSYGSALFGGLLNLSTITMAADGMGFTLTGTLTNMWYDDSLGQSVLSDISSATAADFTMYVATNKDLVRSLNKGSGTVKTSVVSGQVSIPDAHATPEPASLALLASALGLSLVFFARQRQRVFIQTS
ncbi:hypothetical protein AAU61_02885 [Desulfocarbo indianensis]|nr:hypothetical protein AAU61_02885 [Desulfocarbo indianensis]